MEDEFKPLITLPLEDPDMNEQDLQAEFARMIFRNRAIQQFTDGEIPPGELLDILAEDGIEPYDWLECSLENIDFLLRCGN